MVGMIPYQPGSQFPWQHWISVSVRHKPHSSVSMAYGSAAPRKRPRSGYFSVWTSAWVAWRTSLVLSFCHVRESSPASRRSLKDLSGSRTARTRSACSLRLPAGLLTGPVGNHANDIGQCAVRLLFLNQVFYLAHRKRRRRSAAGEPRPVVGESGMIRWAR